MTVANQKGSNSSKPAASCRYPSTGSFPWCSFFGTELHYDILTEVYPLQRSCFQFLEFTAPHNQAVIPSMLLPPLYPMSHLWLRSGHQTWLENFPCRWFSKTSMSRSCYNMLLTVNYNIFSFKAAFWILSMSHGNKPLRSSRGPDWYSRHLRSKPSCNPAVELLGDSVILFHMTEVCNMYILYNIRIYMLHIITQSYV
jgi:hypothetical protein